MYGIFNDSCINCYKYDVDSFAQVTDFSSKLNVLHINIRSFSRNFDEFSVLMSRFSFNVDVLVLSETWFSFETTCDIPGYTAFHTHREDKRGGGISVYIDERFGAATISAVSFLGNTFECCSARLHMQDKYIDIVGIYRPPSNLDENFNSEFEERVLSSLISSNISIVTGDFNIDLTKPNRIERDFINLMYTFAFSSLISEPTRVTNESSSLLDHIWINGEIDCCSSVVEVHITDHFMIHAALSVPKKYNFFQKTFRDHSGTSMETLISRAPTFVSKYNGCNFEDINGKTDYFMRNLFELYEKCCPLRSKHIPKEKMAKPWLTKDLCALFKAKHILFKMYKKGDIEFDIYNNYKNHCTKILKKSKSVYFRNKFESARNNVKAMWRNVNQILNRKSKKSQFFSLKDGNNNCSIDNQGRVCEMFADYFARVAVDLETKIPSSDISPLSYINNSHANSFYVGPVLPSVGRG